MRWEGKRVLVTGAGGFIGSHLVERLIELGATVTAFLRYTSRADLGSLRFLPEDKQNSLRPVFGDLRDPDAVARVAAGQNVIMHLGALIGIPYSYVHPVEYVQTNVVGTTHLLRASTHDSLERFVQTSTSEVYGSPRYVPIDEDHPLQGQSPYSASKIAADKIAESFFRAFQLPVATARPFNTYGPRQLSRAVIPTIVSQVLTTGEVRLGSLHPRRDLTFVADTVEGLLKVAEVEAATGQVVNIGSAKEISIEDLRDKIISLMGRRPAFSIDEERIRPERSEVDRLLAATGKAETLLGWKPKVSLADGLRRTIAWIEEHKTFYQVRGYHI